MRLLQVGLAEAGVAMAKLAARQGDQVAAATHVAAALGHYSEHLCTAIRSCLTLPLDHVSLTGICSSLELEP